MKKRTTFLAILFLFLWILVSSDHVVSASIAGNESIIGDHASAPLTVSDFFLTDDELPPGWIPDPSVYTPGAYMDMKEKLMGGDWWSVRIRDSAMTKMLHVTIGLFPTEAEAIKYADPDTYIFLTDPYVETGQTFT